VSNKETVTILGVDPGLAHCGWGVIRLAGSRKEPLAYGCIATTPQDGGTAARLKMIHDELCTVIGRYHPTELGIETVYMKGNLRSAMATAQARGAALVAAAGLEVAVGEYSPSEIKQSVVGTGAADKEQVQYMVRAILNLNHTPSPDHAADALAAAICHAHRRGVTAT
jgi:crossover junction endodeoxyribonuclease RuvC